MNQVQQFVYKELEQRVAFFGLQVVSTAQRLHTIADHLRQDQLAQGAANLVDRGAESVEDIGHYLESATVDSLASKAESFGRGRPLTFVTIAFALGVAGSRILKAAAARRYGVSEAQGEPVALRTSV